MYVQCLCAKGTKLEDFLIKYYHLCFHLHVKHGLHILVGTIILYTAHPMNFETQK